MSEWWRGSVPEGLAVVRVVGVCFDRAGMVVMVLRGLRTVLPSVRVHGTESARAALQGWLGCGGLRVLRSGPLGYERAPGVEGRPASAVAFRVAVVEDGPPQGAVVFTRVRVAPGAAAAAARRGGVGRSRMRIAARVAAGFWRELDEPAPPPGAAGLGRGVSLRRIIGGR